MKKAATAEGKTDPTTWDIGKRDTIVDLGFRTEGSEGQFNAVAMHDATIRVPSEGTVIDLDTLVSRCKEYVQKNGLPTANDPLADKSTNVVNFASIEDAADAPVALDPDEEESTLEEELGINDDLEDDDLDVVDVEPDGQGLLPGQEKLVCQPLTDAALDYHAAKNERIAATARETASRNQLKLMAAQHQKFFAPDPNNDDALIYVAARQSNGKQIIVRDQKTWEEKLTTEEVAAE